LGARRDLKRLENKDLALEPTQKVPIVRGREPASKRSMPDAKTPATPAVGKPATSKPAPAKTAGGKPVAPKTAARHPALQPHRRSDGGFDPYNSR
jgi:hypothetical protein